MRGGSFRTATEQGEAAWHDLKGEFKIKRKDFL